MAILHGVLNNPSTTTLPALLCLHGSGSNSTIFNVQTIRLQHALSSTFQFIFIDAPFASSPGPGVHPTFEGCDPYFRWMPTLSGLMPEETRRLIDETLSSLPKTNFVGVLGFSQGAKVAAGLLLEQQLQKGAQVENRRGFKFGVFCMGVNPPLVSEKFSVEQRKQKLAVPSVCVIGTEDPWRDEGRKLFEDCDKESSTLIELETGHRLPISEEGTERIAKEILRLHKLTSELTEPNNLEGVE